MPTKQTWLSKDSISHSTTTASLGLLGCLCLALLPVREAGAQGTVILANSGPGWTTHIWGPGANNPFSGLTGLGANDIPSGTTPYLESGMTLIGTCGPYCLYGYATTFAQLLGAVGANQPESALAPVGYTTTFRSGSAVGTLIAITNTLWGIPKDAPAATFELVAWDNRSGMFPTWTQASYAWYSGQTAAGRSPPFTVFAIGGDTNPPPYLSNGQGTTNALTSFNLWYYLDWPFPPEVWTEPATNVTANSAILQSSVLSHYLGSYAWFQWGTTTLYSSNTTHVLVYVDSWGASYSFTASFTGLSPGTTYHFRGAADNGLWGYGGDESFTTLLLPRIVTINTGRGYWDAASSSISYSASGGSTGSVNSFILLQSADPAAPLSGWTRVATNVGTPGSFPIPPVGTAAPRYYRIKSE